MEEEKPKRRDFIKMFGLTVGASVAGLNAMASFPPEEIRELNASQREFMTRYGVWMDEYVELIKLQKLNPENTDIKKEIVAHAEAAEKFQAELREHMKDGTFSVIFKEAIKKVSSEI